MTPYSSFAAVMYAAMLHTIEAIIIAGSSSADGSIGVAALLSLTSNNRYAACAMMAMSVVCAAIVLCKRRLSAVAAVLLLVPQQVLLMKTGIAAWLAVWNGSYADGVLRSTLFITADQLPRGMFSLIHMTAIFGLACYHARGGASGLRDTSIRRPPPLP